MASGVPVQAPGARVEVTLTKLLGSEMGCPVASVSRHLMGTLCPTLAEFGIPVSIGWKKPLKVYVGLLLRTVYVALTDAALLPALSLAPLHVAVNVPVP